MSEQIKIIRQKVEEPVEPRQSQIPTSSLRENKYEETSSGGGEAFFNNLSKIAVLGVVFLTPLFFFPNSDFGISKQLLLSFLALLAFGGWVGKTIAGGEMRIKYHWILAAIGLMSAASFLSIMFSSSQWVSFLGQPGRYVSSGISLFSYILVFLVVFQIFDRKDAGKALILWLSSSFLIAISSLVQLFNLGDFSLWKLIIPFDFVKDRLFNPIGSVSHLALFLLAPIPFICARFLDEKRLWMKIILVAMAGASVSVAFLADSASAWIGLIGGSAVLVAMTVLRPAKNNEERKMYQRKLLLPLIIIIVSVFLWWLNLPGPRWIGVQAEVMPSHPASLKIFAEAFKKFWDFGSGLETYPYVYAQFKSPALNQTNFWGVNFNRASSEILTWMTTTGILGTAALFGFIGLFAAYAFKDIFNSNEEDFGIKTGLFSSWVFILISKFISSTPLALEIFFWLIPVFFLSFGIAEKAKKWMYRFESGTWLTLGAICALIAVFLLNLAGIYLTIERWLGERAFAKAIELAENKETRDESLAELSKALIAAQYDPRYFRSASQILLAKINDISSQIQERPADQRRATENETAQLQNLAVQIINSARRAIALEPENPGLLSEAAEIYLSLVSMIGGADAEALRLYERASLLEPINPFLKTQIGRLYLDKSNLLGAGKTDEEMSEKAESTLKQAIELNPNYSNAHFFLSLFYDAKGKQKEALSHMEIVAALNPDDKTIKEILGNIKAGRPALKSSAQITPPESSEKEIKGEPDS